MVVFSCARPIPVKSTGRGLVRVCTESRVLQINSIFQQCATETCLAIDTITIGAAPGVRRNNNPAIYHSICNSIPCPIRIERYDISRYTRCSHRNLFIRSCSPSLGIRISCRPGHLSPFVKRAMGSTGRCGAVTNLRNRWVDIVGRRMRLRPADKGQTQKQGYRERKKQRVPFIVYPEVTREGFTFLILCMFVMLAVNVDPIPLPFRTTPMSEQSGIKKNAARTAHPM